MPSHLNPADAASRGMTPSTLTTNTMWWEGPPFLKQSHEEWPKLKLFSEQNIPEIRKKTINELPNILHLQPIDDENEILHRYSNLSQLLTTTAYCLRIAQKIKHKRKHSSTLHFEKILTSNEINNALNHWIKYTQQFYFLNEIKSIRQKQYLPVKNKLNTLNPFLDENEILRVGGRLTLAKQIPFGQRHPIILPTRSHLTWLLIQWTHKLTLHGGIQLTMQQLRQKYWIIHGKKSVRSFILKCNKCIRYTTKPIEQLMANLPASRISPNLSFTHTGLDYAGPFDLRSSWNRNASTIKGYICLFICFCTKAIHLEIVRDLSTNTFLTIFKKFIARRGMPSDLYSDRGKNFIGANRELKLMFNNPKSTWNEYVVHQLAKQQIQWHFNPPGASSMGGIWERQFRSVRYHLNRVLGNTRLTPDVMDTVVTQIEGCINSRPLTAMSSDPSDLNPLTPGHFLTGRSILSTPDKCVLDTQTNHLQIFQRSQQLIQQFWDRWQKEYLSDLQVRQKWHKHLPNIQIGDLVLIKDDRFPPTYWPLARVIKTFPDKEGLIRAALVKTATSQY